MEEQMVRRKHNSRLTTYARSLRSDMTREERKLWYEFLRTYPVKFYKQKVLGNYIVDFYCAKAKLVIELDGSQHYEEDGLLKDIVRTEFIEQYGIKVIRIPNNVLNHYFRDMCEYINNEVEERIGCKVEY